MKYSAYLIYSIYVNCAIYFFSKNYKRCRIKTKKDTLMIRQLCYSIVVFMRRINQAFVKSKNILFPHLLLLRFHQHVQVIMQVIG